VLAVNLVLPFSNLAGNLGLYIALHAHILMMEHRWSWTFWD